MILLAFLPHNFLPFIFPFPFLSFFSRLHSDFRPCGGVLEPVPTSRTSSSYHHVIISTVHILFHTSFLPSVVTFILTLRYAFRLPSLSAIPNDNVHSLVPYRLGCYIYLVVTFILTLSLVPYRLGINRLWALSPRRRDRLQLSLFLL